MKFYTFDKFVENALPEIEIEVSLMFFWEHVIKDGTRYFCFLLDCVSFPEFPSISEMPEVASLGQFADFLLFTHLFDMIFMELTVSLEEKARFSLTIFYFLNYWG